MDAPRSRNKKPKKNRLGGALRFKYNKLINRNIKDLLKEQKVGIIDVGAAGGLEPRWLPYEPYLKTFAFEPDERSAKALPPNIEVFSVALYSEDDTKTINLCRKPRTSSLYLPNVDLLKRYPSVERFDVLAQESVQTTTLDKALANNPGPFHFLKLDVQGTELEILRGGVDTISKSLLGAEIEVEFVPLYENAALFGNISEFMTSMGFEFIDFVRLSKWERDSYRGLGQCAFGDALFLKSPETLVERVQSIEESARAEIIVSYFIILAVYRKVDLAQVLLNYVSSMINEDQERIMRNVIGIMSKRLDMHDRLMKIASAVTHKIIPHSGYISKV